MQSLVEEQEDENVELITCFEAEVLDVSMMAEEFASRHQVVLHAIQRAQLKKSKLERQLGAELQRVSEATIFFIRV